MGSSIDVIVPVFNKAGRIMDCLASLFAQEAVTLTVICIDDGSTDTSGALLDEAAAAHGNLVVRHTENRGVSAARNLGLSLVKSERFCFCDADDVLLPGALKALLEAAETAGSPLTAGFIEKETAEGKTVFSYEIPGVFTGREAILSKGLEAAFNACYAKLFLSERYKDLRFDEDLRVNEDGLYVTRALCETDKLTVIPTPVYRYRYEPDSASHGAFGEKYRGILTAGERKQALVSGAGFEALGEVFSARHKLMYLNKMVCCDSGYTLKELRAARRAVLKSAHALLPESRTERIRLFLIRHAFGVYRRIMFSKSRPKGAKE